MLIIFANYAPPPPSSPQTVGQELLAAPLVPPQLSVKDFYMTGEAAVHSTKFFEPSFETGKKPKPRASNSTTEWPQNVKLGQSCEPTLTFIGKISEVNLFI